MTKIKFNQPWSEIGHNYIEALKRLFTGLGTLLFNIVLTVTTLVIRAYEWLVKAIRNFPCVANGATFLIMAVLSVFVYADMKAKLNTAYYQKDQMEMRLDSAVNKGVQTAKYQSYKAE